MVIIFKNLCYFTYRHVQFENIFDESFARAQIVIFTGIVFFLNVIF